MSTARTIAKNTAVLFTATIISYILTFFVNIYIARYLGAEGFGILSLAIALTGIFTIFTDLGLPKSEGAKAGGLISKQAGFGLVNWLLG